MLKKSFGEVMAPIIKRQMRYRVKHIFGYTYSSYQVQKRIDFILFSVWVKVKETHSRIDAIALCDELRTNDGIIH